MIELEHSPLGGSGAKRWLNCSGSFLLHRALLEAGELEELPSEYASRGTAAHELGAMCLLDEREPWEFLGTDIAGFKVGYDEGQIDPDAVAIYVNHCEAIWPRDGKGQVLIETTLKQPDLHPLLKGTIDFGYWSVKRGLHLRDYKNGAGIYVSPFNNEQLLYYAFLLAMEYDWLKQGPADFPVSLGIVQPNNLGIFEEPEVWHTTLGHVLTWGQDVLLPRMKALTQAQDVDDSDFVSGDHCQFCPVLLDCPRMQDAFKTFANGTEFVEMLSDEEVSAFYAVKADAKRFMTELEKVTYARLIGGSEITSAKLVAKRTSRDWKAGADTALAEAFGEAAYKKSLKSPAEIEKLSSRGKALALEFGFMPESTGMTVAPIGDPKPAVKPPSNASTFEAFAGNHEYEGF